MPRTLEQITDEFVMTFTNEEMGQHQKDLKYAQLLTELEKAPHNVPLTPNIKFEYENEATMYLYRTISEARS